jgi:hypothetical protein
MGGAVFNAKFLTGGATPNVSIFAGSSAGAITTAAGTLTGSLAYPSGDVITSFGGGVWVFRYWRFRVACGSVPFTMGKVMLGAEINSDVMGYLYGPDSSFEIVTPTNEISDADGDPIQLITGKTRRRYRYVYTEIPDADRAQFESIAEESRPFGLIDPMGNHNHVILRRAAGSPFQHLFGATLGIWTVQIEMEQLP